MTPTTGKQPLDFFYERLEPNILLDILKEKEISAALTYMVTFLNLKGLTVTPRKYSIEITNNQVTIAVILFVGFEQEEYRELQNRPNLHLVTFNQIIFSMIEFEKLDIKFIDKMSLLFMVMSRSKKPFLKTLNVFRNLEV